MRDYSSFTYLGVYSPAPDVWFLKAGKSDSPETRMKSYATMVPGGLTFMKAVRVRSSAEAHVSEQNLMVALLAQPAITAVGGEWFRCAAGGLEAALSCMAAIGPEVMHIEGYARAAFGTKRRVRALPVRDLVGEVQRQRQQLQSWRDTAATERASVKGHCGPYGGTLRG